MPTVFFSYSHADEGLRNQLEKQLSLLRRQGLIETWHDRKIGAGQELDREIDTHIETDGIILLLVSPDFLDSDYCYNREMQRALERHEDGTAIVIPVILRPCDWQHAPFGHLLATPTDGRPVTKWPDRDEAMLEVAKAVRGAAERLGAHATPQSPATPLAPVAGTAASLAAPRSSNLRVAKQFTERDRDSFRAETFEYIARYFENSLAELQTRNPGIEGSFRRIDANRFTAVAYRHGDALARCTVFMGGRHFGEGIGFSHTDSGDSNSFNENLTVEADEQSMFLRSMGMGLFQPRQPGRTEAHPRRRGGTLLGYVYRTAPARLKEGGCCKAQRSSQAV